MGNFGITDIYIVSMAGISLLHRDYTEAQPVNRSAAEDSQLLTGLMSAIFMLAKEMGQEDIRSMTMGDQNFFYEVSGELIYILGVQSDFPESVAQEILSKLKKCFLDHYLTLSSAEAIDSDSYEKLGPSFDAILQQTTDHSARRSAEDKIVEIQAFLDDILGSAGIELLQTHLSPHGKSWHIETRSDWEKLFSGLLTDLSVMLDESQAQQLIDELKDIAFTED